MNRITGVLAIFLVLCGPLFAQTDTKKIEEAIFDSPTLKLQSAMREIARRQAIYAYIIANAATPDIDLVALLAPEDRQEFYKSLPPGANPRNYILDYVSAKMGQFNGWNGYEELLKAKNTIFKTVVSRGQG